jgi:hypothetical protein
VSNATERLKILNDSGEIFCRSVQPLKKALASAWALFACLSGRQILSRCNAAGVEAPVSILIVGVRFLGRLYDAKM